MKKILVTGGCGFIGANFIRWSLDRYPDLSIVNLDSLTYAGNPENLLDIEKSPRYTFVKGDISDTAAVTRAMQGVEGVINFAAESFVDRSIKDPSVFVRTNVAGTECLLRIAKDMKVSRYLQVSTDEVYGSLGPTGLFTEETSIAPNSPYSASKAGADLMVRAFYETFGFPAVITRCSNNYGPYQFPEKLIPFFIYKAMKGDPVPLYGDGLNVRDWIYVLDHVAALDLVLRRGTPGQVYNIGANNERTNREITERILSELNKPVSMITYVQDRPGHDRRYAIDSSKIQNELGWTPQYSFEKALHETVQWYLKNEGWWKRILSKEYLDYAKAYE